LVVVAEWKKNRRVMANANFCQYGKQETYKQLISSAGFTATPEVHGQLILHGPVQYGWK